MNDLGKRTLLSAEHARLEGSSPDTPGRSQRTRRSEDPRLATQLKSKNGALDLSYAIKLLEQDIAVIYAGLAKLNSAATV